MKEKVSSTTKRVPLRTQKQPTTPIRESLPGNKQKPTEKNSEGEASEEQRPKPKLPPQKFCGSCGTFISVRTLCQACQKRKQRAQAQMDAAKEDGTTEPQEGNDTKSPPPKRRKTQRKPTPITTAAASRTKRTATSTSKPRCGATTPLGDLDNVTCVADGLRRVRLLWEKIDTLYQSESSCDCKTVLVTCQPGGETNKTKRSAGNANECTILGANDNDENQESVTNPQCQLEIDDCDEDQDAVSAGADETLPKLGVKRKRTPQLETDCTNALAKLSAVLKSQIADDEVPVQSSISAQKPVRKRRTIRRDIVAAPPKKKKKQQQVEPIAADNGDTALSGADNGDHDTNCDAQEDPFVRPRPGAKRKAPKKTKKVTKPRTKRDTTKKATPQISSSSTTTTITTKLQQDEDGEGAPTDHVIAMKDMGFASIVGMADSEDSTLFQTPAVEDFTYCS